MSTYHPLSERIVDILVRKVNSENRHYFRILVAYYFSKVASMMRCNISTQDRGIIPVNLYVLNLLRSGEGKGHSTDIMEREFVAEFKEEFLHYVFPTKANAALVDRAYLLADADIAIAKSGGSVSVAAALPRDELKDIKLTLLEKQFEALGELAFSFDSGTSPAVKQMREKLLLAKAGSMNLELDEIGSNMSSNVDMLNVFLELYDKGLVKQKLIKNTLDNTRSKEIPGETPTNLMMFGTPIKLLDGGKTEDEFKQFLETGFARRLLFGYNLQSERMTELSAAERYKQMTDATLEKDMDDVKRIFAKFASGKFNRVLTIDEVDAIYLIEYQIKCEKAASKLKEHQVVQQAELIHRYFKVLKTAGAYAFVDNTPSITRTQLDAAIDLAEESGRQFNNMLAKKGAYERLANFLVDAGREVTQHEMLEELPFYKGNAPQRKDMMTLAISYGYRNNIVIKKRIQDGIEFYSGEALQKVNMDNLTLSIGQDLAQGYAPGNAPFDQLHKLTTAAGYHYCSHNFIGGHRTNNNAIPGVDTIILDIDGGTSIDTAKILLADYKFLLSTTKSHTETDNRYRIILPMSHHLKLPPTEFSKFMENVFEWLPFEVDPAAKDAARKWATHAGQYSYNEGALIDATMFIPQTRKSEAIKKHIDSSSIPSMERWFTQHTERGNRAVMLYRYGCVLIDAGVALGELIQRIENFNANLTEPISEEQLRNSTIKSLSKKLQGI